MPQLKTNNVYDLVWIVNGNVKETVLTNVSYSIAKWKAAQLKKTTHKTGLLMPRKVK